MVEVVPVPALGGVLIAIACSLNLLLSGLLASSSDAVFVLTHFGRRGNNFRWKSCFVAGIALSALSSYHFHGQKGRILSYHIAFFETQLNSPPFYLALGGILSGLGMRMCRGCITEHGMCGVALLIKRSFVALILMIVSAVFTALSLHSNGYPATPVDHVLNKVKFPILAYYEYAALVTISLVAVFLISKPKEIVKHLCSLFIGFVFGMGCQLGGFCRVSSMKAFVVTFGQDQWDTTVGQAMGAAIVGNLILFSLILRKRKPVFGSAFLVPRADSEVSNAFVVGAILYGIGWGMTSMTPGMAIIMMLVTKDGFIYVISLALGTYLHTIFTGEKLKVS